MKSNRSAKRPSSIFSRLVDWSWQHHLIMSFVVILGATVIFGLRNQLAFSLPNFYAEDATVLFQNIYSHNPLQVLLTAFNGYLIVGQYLLAYVAVAVNFLLGNDLANLPIVTAIVSCAFLGLAASLPFLLFRRNLGTPLSLVLVLLLAFIPLKSYDYAIIGTISNLKFVFLYIAFMLVVYRAVAANRSLRRTVIIDVLLLICTLTNATVAFLLPFTVLPYLPQWWRAIRSRQLFSKFTYSSISALVLSTLGLLYAAAAVLKGIPKIPGYLDGPFNPQAALPIFDRSTYYGLAYPFTISWNDWFVGGLLLITVLMALYLIWRRGERAYVIAAASWAIFLGTGLFIFNRPGIGDYYLSYGHKGGPDQFFFAQNMIFIFALGWLARDFVRRFSVRAWSIVAIGTALYLLVAIPFGTSYGGSAVVFKEMKTIDFNITKACNQYKNQEDVIIQIYPTTYWQWKVDKDIACN